MTHILPTVPANFGFVAYAARLMFRKVATSARATTASSLVLPTPGGTDQAPDRPWIPAAVSASRIRPSVITARNSRMRVLHPVSGRSGPRPAPVLACRRSSIVGVTALHGRYASHSRWVRTIACGGTGVRDVAIRPSSRSALFPGFDRASGVGAAARVSRFKAASFSSYRPVPF